MKPLESQTAANNLKRVRQGQGVYLQHHRPRPMEQFYHAHPSIETNYLQECDMTYSFGGDLVHIPCKRFCLFWGARPHRVVSVNGVGTITNAQLSLEEVLSWSLPADFVDALMAGGVIIASKVEQSDEAFAARLASERYLASEAISRLHCLELQARITRLALSGWELIGPTKRELRATRLRGKAPLHLERMLRYIGESFADPITLEDVAGASGVSATYANTLFKRFLGTTAKSYVTDVRVSHARTMLSETDESVIGIAMDSGFGSLSSFYDAFSKSTGSSPAAFRRNSATSGQNDPRE